MKVVEICLLDWRIYKILEILEIKVLEIRAKALKLKGLKLKVLTTKARKQGGPTGA